MKKHLTSIQSTRPGQEMSIFSYDDRSMKLNYKTEIQKLFDSLHSVLTLRSYLLLRDFEQVFQNCETFFFKILCVSSPKELWAFAFPKNKDTDKIHEKQQVAFLVKLVLEIDKMRKTSANQGRTKQFQALKNAMQFLEQKIAVYEQAIRKKKYNDQVQRRLKEKDQKQNNFIKFEQAVKKNLQARQKNMKTSFLQRLHNQDEKSLQETDKLTARHIYKSKPSKLLSEAKDISLKVKLSPYASQLKRNYDYKTLQSSLSKTLDLDMNRKLSMIAHMKKVEKDKLNRDHKKRYSVMEDHFKEEKNLTQRQLIKERTAMENSFHIGMEQLYEKSIRKEYNRINSLQKSFNAYNLHSDSKQIRNIIRSHKQTTQFSNEISDVGDLRTSKDYNPIYSTITSQMLGDEHANNNKRRESQHEKKILRRFNRSNKEIEREGDSDAEADDICGSNRKVEKMQREKSLVALYDNQLNEVKEVAK